MRVLVRGLRNDVIKHHKQYTQAHKQEDTFSEKKFNEFRRMGTDKKNK